jgi:hypothetical protein
MIEYDVVFHRTAVSFLLGRASRERRLLLQFLDRLGNDPYQVGDFDVADATGRRHEVKRIGGVRVTFWPDHAVKEVHVTSIERI